MKRSRTIRMHLIVWMALSLIFFFSSEALLNLILPEIHDVNLWIKFTCAGLILVFLGVVTSLIIQLVNSVKKV